MERVKIDCLDVFCFRVPIDAPVSTSFGRMLNRPGVFVRITDRDGVFGWGEVFANWPAAGAEHRAQLLMQDIADLVLGFEARQPTELFYHLCARTHIRALQCGEWGPFAQVIAGLDTALHDLFARRSGLALARFLNPSAGNDVQVYASGIHVENGSGTIEALRADGHRSFKVKIGFEVKSDLRHLARCASALQPGEQLFADANQAWSLENAMVFADAARELGLGWIEEPLCADKPEAQWAVLADACSIPIAAGENIADIGAFKAMIAAGHVNIIQPDIAKWGGVTGCYDVARKALLAGRSYCPHFLGGGVGLLASAHLLAAAGGPGLLEVDVNPNPLRTAFADAPGPVKNGRVAISHAPGLGITRLPEAIVPFETLRLSRRHGP